MQVLLVMKRGRYAERLLSSLAETDCDVTHIVAAEGIIPRLSYASPDAFVIAADLPELRLFGITRSIRKTHGFERTTIIGLVRSVDEEREAEATACDVILRIPFVAAALAREVRLRVDLEIALRGMAATDMSPGRDAVRH